MTYHSNKMNKRILHFLQSKFKNDSNNSDFLKSKNLLRIYENSMDTGSYETALECCGELLRLNPDLPESNTLLQIQENLKKKMDATPNHEKKGPCGTTVTPKKVSLNNFKKYKGKMSKIKSQAAIEPLKLNIPKECSSRYTPNSRFLLSLDADVRCKYGRGEVYIRKRG